MPHKIPNRFHPLIARWFADRLGSPTEVQLRAWEEVIAGQHLLVSREFNPRKRVNVERINGVSAGESAYRQALIEFGFQTSYRGLEFWRGY